MFFNGWASGFQSIGETFKSINPIKIFAVIINIFWALILLPTFPDVALAKSMVDGVMILFFIAFPFLSAAGILFGKIVLLWRLAWVLNILVAIVSAILLILLVISFLATEYTQPPKGADFGVIISWLVFFIVVVVAVNIFALMPQKPFPERNAGREP